MLVIVDFLSDKQFYAIEGLITGDVSDKRCSLIDFLEA